MQRLACAALLARAMRPAFSLTWVIVGLVPESFADIFAKKLDDASNERLRLELLACEASFSCFGTILPWHARNGWQ